MSTKDRFTAPPIRFDEKALATYREAVRRKDGDQADKARSRIVPPRSAYERWSEEKMSHIVAPRPNWNVDEILDELEGAGRWAEAIKLMDSEIARLQKSRESRKRERPRIVSLVERQAKAQERRRK